MNLNIRLWADDHGLDRSGSLFHDGQRLGFSGESMGCPHLAKDSSEDWRVTFACNMTPL